MTAFRCLFVTGLALGGVMLHGCGARSSGGGDAVDDWIATLLAPEVAAPSESGPVDGSAMVKSLFATLKHHVPGTCRERAGQWTVALRNAPTPNAVTVPIYEKIYVHLALARLYAMTASAQTHDPSTYARLDAIAAAANGRRSADQWRSYVHSEAANRRHVRAGYRTRLAFVLAHELGHVCDPSAPEAAADREAFDLIERAADDLGELDLHAAPLAILEMAIHKQLGGASGGHRLDRARLEGLVRIYEERAPDLTVSDPWTVSTWATTRSVVECLYNHAEATAAFAGWKKTGWCPPIDGQAVGPAPVSWSIPRARPPSLHAGGAMFTSARRGAAR